MLRRYAMFFRLYHLFDASEAHGTRPARAVASGMGRQRYTVAAACRHADRDRVTLMARSANTANSENARWWRCAEVHAA